MIRHRLTALCPAFGASFVPFAGACAEAPAIHTQVPGYYRAAVGEIRNHRPLRRLRRPRRERAPNANKAEVQRLLSAAVHCRREGPDGGQPPTSSTRRQTHPRRHRRRQSLRPNPSGSSANILRAAGYTPEQIDIVLLTHLHADHVAGNLLGADGKPQFPNAEVR